MTTLDIAFNSLKKTQTWDDAKSRFPGLEAAILQGLRSESDLHDESDEFGQPKAEQGQTPKQSPVEPAPEAPPTENSIASERVEAQNPNMTWRRALLGQGEAHDPERALREARRALTPSPKVGVVPSIANRTKDMFRRRVIDPMMAQAKGPAQPMQPTPPTPSTQPMQPTPPTQPMQPTPVEPTPKARDVSPYA